MKLFELKLGFGAENTAKDKFWVLFRKDSIYFFPRLSGTLTKDAQSAIAGRELKTGEFDKEAYDKLQKILYDGGHDPVKVGWALVDRTHKTIDLDISKVTGNLNRRQASKIKNFNHKAKESYPILGGELGFKRVVDFQKAMKALVAKSPDVSDFKIIGDDRFDDMSVKDVVDAKTDIKSDHRRLYDTKAEDIVMYHGTSAKRYKKIKIEGLNPGKRSEEEAYCDQIPNYSSNNVYLSFTPALAANYAVREAINDGSDAVILAVKLNRIKFDKLKPDDDSMHWLLATVDKNYVKKFVKENPIIDELWDGNYEVHFKHFDHKNQRVELGYVFDSSSSADFIKRGRAVLEKYGFTKNSPELKEMEHTLYFNIVKCFIEGAHDRSAKKEGTVAYQGRIPNNLISVVKTWTIKGTKIKSDGSSEEFNAAIDKQKETVRKG